MSDIKKHMAEYRRSNLKQYAPVTNGHVWIREDDGIVDVWRVAEGFHNGPECALCGESFCEHCSPDRIKETCRNA